MVKARQKPNRRSPAKASRPAARRTPVPARKSRAAPVKKAKAKRKKPMVDHDKNHDKDKHAAPPPPPVSKEPLAGGIKGATGQPAVALPPEAYMTEQEKAGLAGETKTGPSEAAPAKKETK